MHSQVLDTRWDEIANMIHAKWARFSKRQIESLRGNLDDLAALIQKVYGYARAHAEHECHQFQLGLRRMLISETNRHSKV